MPKRPARRPPPRRPAAKRPSGKAAQPSRKPMSPKRQPIRKPMSPKRQPSRKPMSPKRQPSGKPMSPKRPKPSPRKLVSPDFDSETVQRKKPKIATSPRNVSKQDLIAKALGGARMGPPPVATPPVAKTTPLSASVAPGRKPSETGLGAFFVEDNASLLQGIADVGISVSPEAVDLTGHDERTIARDVDSIMREANKKLQSDGEESHGEHKRTAGESEGHTEGTEEEGEGGTERSDGSDEYSRWGSDDTSEHSHRHRRRRRSRRLSRKEAHEREHGPRNRRSEESILSSPKGSEPYSSDSESSDQTKFRHNIAKDVSMLATMIADEKEIASPFSHEGSPENVASSAGRTGREEVPATRMETSTQCPEQYLYARSNQNLLWGAESAPPGTSAPISPVPFRDIDVPLEAACLPSWESHSRHPYERSRGDDLTRGHWTDVQHVHMASARAPSLCSFHRIHNSEPCVACEEELQLSYERATSPRCCVCLHNQDHCRALHTYPSTMPSTEVPLSQHVTNVHIYPSDRVISPQGFVVCPSCNIPGCYDSAHVCTCRHPQRLPSSRSCLSPLHWEEVNPTRVLFDAEYHTPPDTPGSPEWYANVESGFNGPELYGIEHRDNRDLLKSTASYAKYGDPTNRRMIRKRGDFESYDHPDLLLSPQEAAVTYTDDGTSQITFVRERTTIKGPTTDQRCEFSWEYSGDPHLLRGRRPDPGQYSYDRNRDREWLNDNVTSKLDSYPAGTVWQKQKFPDAHYTGANAFGMLENQFVEPPKALYAAPRTVHGTNTFTFETPSSDVPHDTAGFGVTIGGPFGSRKSWASPTSRGVPEVRVEESRRKCSTTLRKDSVAKKGKDGQTRKLTASADAVQGEVVKVLQAQLGVNGQQTRLSADKIPTLPKKQSLVEHRSAGMGATADSRRFSRTGVQVEESRKNSSTTLRKDSVRKSEDGQTRKLTASGDAFPGEVVQVLQEQLGVNGQQTQLSTEKIPTPRKKSLLEHRSSGVVATAASRRIGHTAEGGGSSDDLAVDQPRTSTPVQEHSTRENNLEAREEQQNDGVKVEAYAIPAGGRGDAHGLEPAMVKETPLYRKMDAIEAEAVIKEYPELSIEMFPESQIVFAILLLCIIWIVLIVVLSQVSHALPAPTSLPRGTSAWFMFPEWTAERLAETPATSSTGLPKSHSPGVFYCATDFCLKEGLYLRSLMRHERLPCDNFYEFVCSAWTSTMHVSSTINAGVSVSTDTVLEDDIETKLLQYIVEQKNEDVAPIRQLYMSCMDRTKTDDAILAIRDVFRGWPIRDWPLTENVRFSPSDIWFTAGKLAREFGIHALLDTRVGPPAGNSRNRLVELAAPELIFIRSDDTQRETWAIYAAAVQETLFHFGGTNEEVADNITGEIMGALSLHASKSSLPCSGTTEEVKLTRYSELNSGLQQFLFIVFESLFAFHSDTLVVLRNPGYLQTDLDGFLQSVSARAVLNYLGFRLVVFLAPFMSDRLINLKKIFSIFFIGRTIPQDKVEASRLCLQAVNSVLPECLLRGYARIRTSSDDYNARIWLSQLESLFIRNVHQLSWIDNITAAFVDKKLKKLRLARFFPHRSLDEDVCTSIGPVMEYGSSPLAMYHRTWKRKQEDRLKRLGQGYAREVQWDAMSVFSTRSKYDAYQHIIYVPVGLLNTSVPADSTAFAFHLARFAVRLYRSLVQATYQDSPLQQNLRFGDASQNYLKALLDCFVRDFRSLPSSIRSAPESTVADADNARYSLLEQTVAVQMAYQAFQEQLRVRRIWKMGFRYDTLRNVSSEQLFFLYYALDNCEFSDAAYQRHEFIRFRRIPSEYRVNLPLRHLRQFSRAFDCHAGTAMVLPDNAMCNVMNRSIAENVRKAAFVQNMI